GYNFGAGRLFTPRVEFEVSQHRASVEKQTVAGVESKDPNAFGETDTWRLFANGYLDIDTPMRRYVTPYVGGGVGVGIADFDRLGTSTDGVALSVSQLGFAYNLAAGLSMPLGGRGTMLDVGYRYSRVMGLELGAANGTKSKSALSSHEVLLG